MNPKGKVALVTGGAHRVGKAITMMLAEAGAHVVINYHSSATAANQTAYEVEALDVQALTVQCDVSDYEAVQHMVSAILARFGGVDILVNAHRMVKPGDPLEAIENGLEEMLRQNLLAGLMMSKIVAKRMIQQAKDSDDDRMAGAIVNLTTLAAQRPHPELMAYSIASAAQDQATRALALVLAPQRIRVNSVAFGSVMTAEMQRMLKENPDLRDGIIKGTPMGRIAESEELADAVLYLVGDGAGFVTGQILNVDGGRSLLDPVQAAMF